MLSQLMFAVLVTAMVVQADDEKMTLDDKRFLESLKTEKLPEIEKAVAEAAGAKMKIEVDWNSFDTRDSLNMLEYTLKDIPKGLEEIARDEITTPTSAANAAEKQIPISNCK